MQPVNPLLDLSYATDLIPLEDKIRANNRHQRDRLIMGNLERFSHLDNHLVANDNPYTLFHIYANFREGTSRLPPSLFNKLFWLQAPTPPKVFQKWHQVTRYSGKILVYVEAKKVDDIWKYFVEEHVEGHLGFALRCASAKENPRSRNPNMKLITVHIGNCFDLDEVARVSWTIHDILIDIDKQWAGVFNVLTDFSNEASIVFIRTLDICKPIYKISSYSFFIGRAHKTLEQFVSDFKRNDRTSVQAKETFDRFVDGRDFIIDEGVKA